MSIPRGLCQCGCGQTTNVAPSDRCGYKKGEPFRFVHGHNVGGLNGKYLVDENGCWVWQGLLDRGGYGGGRAHRRYYERLVGPVPEGMQLDHLCRNRACVNPDHLEPVTPSENAWRGANAKLTPELAREIRASSERAVALAARLNVSCWCIYDIRSGRRWAAA